jgi:tRNA G18 (ribose-2'-O)-methylase SpoU
LASTSFIHGFHAITARLRLDAKSVHELYCDAARADPRMRDLVKLAEGLGLRVLQVDTRRLDGMAPPGRHQGVVARVDAVRLHVSLDDLLDELKEPPLLLALDGVQDPHNLGACLRVADAAGCHAVIAPKDRAVGLSATVIKVASGAADSVPYVAVTSFGIFVALDDVYVEGLVHISELGEDYYHFDAARHQMLGERTARRFRLADRVRVKLVRVDLDSSKIDFRLAEDSAPKMSVPKKKRA